MQHRARDANVDHACMVGTAMATLVEARAKQSGSHLYKMNDGSACRSRDCTRQLVNLVLEELARKLDRSLVLTTLFKVVGGGRWMVGGGR